MALFSCAIVLRDACAFEAPWNGNDLTVKGLGEDIEGAQNGHTILCHHIYNHHVNHVFPFSGFQFPLSDVGHSDYSV